MHTCVGTHGKCRVLRVGAGAGCRKSDFDAHGSCEGPGAAGVRLSRVWSRTVTDRDRRHRSSVGGDRWACRGGYRMVPLRGGARTHLIGESDLPSVPRTGTRTCPIFARAGSGVVRSRERRPAAAAGLETAMRPSWASMVWCRWDGALAPMGNEGGCVHDSGT